MKQKGDEVTFITPTLEVRNKILEKIDKAKKDRKPSVEKPSVE